MAATAVETAIAEIAARQAVIEPQLRGLINYSRLSLDANTMREVSLSIEQHQRRTELQRTAKLAMQALMDDGYPDMDPREIPDSAFEELVTEEADLHAARAQFSSGRATEMSVSGGTPVLKEPAKP